MGLTVGTSVGLPVVTVIVGILEIVGDELGKYNGVGLLDTVGV